MEQIKQNQSITSAGRGGFLPYSFSGVLSGAATCFYAFVGFDLVATTGEETENPRMAIPVSICLVLLVCCIVYCSVAVVLTLMIPYYSIRVDASLPDAFDRVGLSHIKIASKKFYSIYLLINRLFCFCFSYTWSYYWSYIKYYWILISITSCFIFNVIRWPFIFNIW
jgi:amino acid transporter